MNSTQLNQLKEIGMHLRQKRQEQSKTLDEIARKTFIPLRLLEALEAGQEETLPEPIFIQGFIRRYGDSLGLQGQELAQKFSPNPLPVINQNPSSEASAASPESITPKTESTESSPLLLGHQSVYLIYLLLGIMAVAGLSYGIGKRQSPQLTQNSLQGTEISNQSSEKQVSSNPATATATQPQESVSSNPATATATQPQESVSSNPATATATQPQEPISPAQDLPEEPSTTTVDENTAVTVDMKLTGESWVKVVIDGKTKFEGILTEGEEQSWTATETVNIIAGNAGAVLLSFNQEDEKPMGLPGAVEKITRVSERS